MSAPAKIFRKAALLSLAQVKIPLPHQQLCSTPIVIIIVGHLGARRADCILRGVLPFSGLPDQFRCF